MNEWGLTAGIVEGVAEVGGSFQGEVHRDADIDSRSPVRGVDISLAVQVSGQGDTDYRQVAGVRVDAARDGRIASTFAVPVPVEGPLSYEGQLMRVQWAIEVTIDVKRRRDSAFEFPVLIIPRGGYGTYTGAHPLRW